MGAGAWVTRVHLLEKTFTPCCALRSGSNPLAFFFLEGPSLTKDPRMASWRKVWRALGPGLTTGAADDDPSGIATYSQAGAQFGFALTWTILLTLPFMAAIQIISLARLADR
jgi:hypothetical protein